MKIAIITLSEPGAAAAARLRVDFPDAALFLHESVSARAGATAFTSIVELTRTLFTRYRGLIYIVPCGVAVRAIAPLLDHKKIDPAVVQTDVCGRYAVSLLSGHEGGANELALRVANCLGAEPVISTTTEAVRTLIVGVGCRRGVAGDVIATAILEGLRRVQAQVSDVRLLASADIKKDEAGLGAAARQLQLSLRFIAAEEIRATSREFTRSALVLAKVGLPAVAEPCALLAGRRTRLLLPKTVMADAPGVTVAIAREEVPWPVTFADAPLDGMDRGDGYGDGCGEGES